MPSSFDVPPEVQYGYGAISSHLRYKGRFSLPPTLQRVVDQFVDYHEKNCVTIIPAGSTFYRARVNDVGQMRPFDPACIGAPPPGRATAGRINPEGISYLYLADSAETALSEVRPWKGATVSIGEFVLSRELRIVGVGQYKWSGGPELVTMMSAVMLTGMFFSAPAHRDDHHFYLASQYIAEAIKNRGVDGLSFRSVLNEGGTNLALFDVQNAECRSVSAHFVKKVEYMSELLCPEDYDPSPQYD